jgi:hypothetical protein
MSHPSYLASRRLLLCIAAMATGLACVANAYAGETPIWRSAPALAPPPPTGVAPAPYPVPVGPVGQISFWAPNRGLLISGGSGPVSAGLYAYDGLNWHQLSTVCGGSEGRIAWAGPDEFWTISDQRAGQDLPSQLGVQSQSISLCHFLDGQVVGSYAMPLAQADSYLHMDAAACYSPSDCWFGGQDGASPNVGAFHLHWDGSSVSVVYGPEDHAVTGMVNFSGELFESVQIAASDVFPPSPPIARTNPAVIHRIAPNESSPTFTNLALYPLQGGAKTLPEYQNKAQPYELGGFTLASDGSSLGVGATQLWAAANATSNSESLTVLHCVEQACASGEGWSQVVPSGTKKLAGVAITSALAPEPGSENVWLSLASELNAKVARMNANGELEAPLVFPGPDEPEVGNRGTAGPINCPAPHDCWMATTTGWLFHYTDGTQYAQDTDPNFAGVITYRPPDAGVPVVYPDLPPVDDSLANQVAPVPTSALSVPAPSTPAKPVKAKALVRRVKSRLVRGRVLVISFVLTARAHVQLIGRRNHHVVAKTRAESLRAGAHTLSLSLNPAVWPTKLNFEVTPVGAPTAGGGSVGGSDTIST